MQIGIIKANAVTKNYKRAVITTLPMLIEMIVVKLIRNNNKSFVM